MKHFKSILATAMIALLPIGVVNAENGYTTTYVPLDHQSATLYQPTVKTDKSSIAVLVMHSDDDYMGFLPNSELSKRGYTVLATVPTYGKRMDQKLINIKRGVEYLRKMQGIKKIVLLGHSGGATTMTAYQLLAEQGIGVLKNKIFSDYPLDLSNLPKADGILLLDANYGNAIMSLVSLEPNINGRGKGLGNVKKYDLADTKVGYNPNGSSNYTENFIKEYSSAQRKRLNDLMADAFNRLSIIKAGKGDYADDEPFIIAGADQGRSYNKLFPEDLSLLSHTKKAWPLIHGNGQVTNEIVRSVRAPMSPDKGRYDVYRAALTTTVKGFLSTCAIKTNKNFRVHEDGIDGIEWTSNINNGEGNAEGITVPFLAVGMTGSWEYLAAEMIYDHCASKDKSVAFVEGASHMFTPDHDAEVYNKANYGDTVKALFNYVDKWLSSNGRFL